jgi:hypothetical protein
MEQRVERARKSGNYNIKKLDPGKEKCQLWHSMKRCRERLGFRLTEALFEQLVAIIKSGQNTDLISVKFKEKQSNRLSMYSVSLKDVKPFNIIYDKQRKTIVTFLYPEDDKLIYHYIDVFGNRMPTKEITGKFWRYDKDKQELTIEGEDITKVSENKWLCGHNLKNMILEYKEGFLYEMMY